MKINYQNIFRRIKKNWGSLLFYAILLALIFSPTAKSWMLQGIISTGLFKADFKNEAPKPTEIAPDFLFSDSNGNFVSSSSLKGKVVLINFWASWCPPCRAEMPSLNKLYLKFKDDNRFMFLFVNEDEDRTKAASYIKKNNFSIPLFYREKVPSQIFSGTLPTTVVLNKQGFIVLKHDGMADYNNEEFIIQLKALL